MGRMARSCFQSLLKVVNSGLGMAGIAMILYSLWMLRVWLLHLGSDHAPIPWFIYTILGLGITLCLITCSGHIAAETANGCCLYIVSFRAIHIVGFFWSNMCARIVYGPSTVAGAAMLASVNVTADVFLNRNWEEDFPEDPTGYFDHLKDFIRENFDICKWIGLTIVALQGLSMLLAMILKALGPHTERYYESDDDYLPDRVPLLKNYVPPQAYIVSDQPYGLRNDSWNVRVNSKVSR